MLDFYADYTKWTKELFGVEKPIIAMCHLLPLPGDPYYDEEDGMEKVIERAAKDVEALQKGGVDGIMFSNEYSLPYLTKIEAITIGGQPRRTVRLLWAFSASSRSSSCSCSACRVRVKSSSSSPAAVRLMLPEDWMKSRAPSSCSNFDTLLLMAG